MLTVNDEKGKNQALCMIYGGTGNGEIIYLKKELDKKSVLNEEPVREARCKDGKFEVLPNEARCFYIAGAQGSGKSFWCGRYIRKFLKLHPDAEFHVFSKVDNDKAFDDLKPHRVTIDNSLITEPIEVNDIKDGSIILFDDVDTISDKKLQNAITSIQNQIYSIGRHKSLTILSAQHLINNGSSTRIVLNEMNCFVFFPSSGSQYQIKYVLTKYFGLSAKQCRRVLELETRAVTIYKNYPQVLVSDHDVIFMNEL